MTERSKLHILPPFEWYTGFGFTSCGILAVMTSSVFHHMYEGRASKLFYQSREYPSLPNLTLPEAERVLADQELVDLIGFRGSEIWRFSEILTRQYTGQYIAPFKVKLTNDQEF